VAPGKQSGGTQAAVPADVVHCRVVQVPSKASPAFVQRQLSVSSSWRVQAWAVVPSAVHWVAPGGQVRHSPSVQDAPSAQPNVRGALPSSGQAETIDGLAQVRTPGWHARQRSFRQ
jgi:hypothetical protein